MSKDSGCANNTFTLRIERVFNAPIERVWKAWTDHDTILKWMSPKGFYVREKAGPVVIGNQYRSVMISPEGEESIYFGEYLEVLPPEKLVFTHTWETDVCGVPAIHTECTVLLSAIDAVSTKMVFTQRGLSSAGSRDSHVGGWSECFDKLFDMVNEVAVGNL